MCSIIYELKDLPTVADKLWKQIEPKPIVAFYGPMGAGKTTLIKAICAVAGVQNTVVSPTFALVNEYRTHKGTPLFHFDFYRINHIEEVYDFGYEEYFYSGHNCLIEWPEKIEELLPKDTLRIHIRVLSESKREISI